MLSKTVKFLLAATIAFTSAIPANATVIDGRFGHYFYRYKGGDFAAAVPGPDQASKDIDAYYVAGVGQPFSEVLPMKPEWQDDTWRLLPSSVLPDGLEFDSATRTFSGTPTVAMTGRSVELEAVDGTGAVIATARATFDVYGIEGIPVKVDLYAHKGLYHYDTLAVPSGVTIDSWERVTMPPSGITVNGPYFEGTPESSGQWQVMIRGKDYSGNVVATFFGKYTVEDGPTFDKIPDDIRGLSRLTQFAQFSFGAPSPHHVHRPINPAQPVNYFLEVDPDTGFAAGTYPRSEKPNNIWVFGSVKTGYEIGRLRYRAVDSDGTVGYSNWFTYGTADPELACVGNGYTTNIKTGTPVNIRAPKPGGAAKNYTYTLTSGSSLPDGLSLSSDGKITGIPLTIGQTVTTSFDIVGISNGQTVPTVVCYTPFSVSAGGVRVSDATPQQNRHLRVGSTYEGLASIKGGITSYELQPETVLPAGFSFTTSTVDTTPVGITGPVTSAGEQRIALELVNGDGNKTSGNIGFTGYDDLAVSNVPTIEVQRLAESKVWGSLPVLPDTVIPDVSGARSYPEAVLSPSSLPLGIFLRGMDFKGATSVAEGVYGPFTASVVDYENKPVTTNAFNVVVTPREEIKIVSVTPPTFTVKWDRPQIAAPVVVAQPPGAKDFAITWSLEGPLPTWLTFDTTSGALTAAAGIPFADIGAHGPFRITATDSENSTTTSDPFDITVTDWPAPSAKVPQSFGGSVSGNTAIGEAATWIAVPGGTATDMREFIDETTVIGGRSAVRFKSVTPANPAGLTFNYSEGNLTGRPTSEFKGDVVVAFEDSEGREGTIEVPLEVKGYPTVSMPQQTYDLARLSEAGTADVPVEASADNGFWNTPNWSVDITRGTDISAYGLAVNRATGIITGRPTSAPGTTIDNIVLKATSRGANGETLESWTAPFGIVITAPKPMTLSYTPSRVVYYLVKDGDNGYTMSASRLTASPIAKVAGSYENPVTFSLQTGDAVAAGMTGDVGINQANGNLTNFPTALGEWTVKAEAKDKTGHSPATPTDIVIKATLDGFVTTQVMGKSTTLRQDERFATEKLNADNYVGTVVYSASPAILPTGLEFDAVTGELTDQSRFASFGQGRKVSINATDSDGRHFEHPVEYSFDVFRPLEAKATIPDIRTRQYASAASGAIDTTFEVTPSYAIGDITYSLEGDLPGTLVNRVYGTDGNFSGWNWKDADGVSQWLPAGTPLPELTLPFDALVFDTRTPSLKGSASKVGNFPGLTIKVHDSHAADYAYASPNQIKYNTAEVGPFAIDVTEGDPLLVVNDKDVDTLHQFTASSSVRTTATGAAAGLPVTWTMISGTLPGGVVATKGQTAVSYSGYPTLKGTYPDIVWRARDRAGRTAQSNGLTMEVGDRLELELAASPSPWGVVEGTELPPFAVTARNAAYGHRIPEASWELPSSGLPADLSMSASTGSARLSGTTSAVGDYSVVVGATDELGSHAKTDVSLSVLDASETIQASAATTTTKANLATDVPVTLRSRVFGTVSYSPKTDVAGARPDGNAVVSFPLAGDYKPVVTVSDSTRRTTDVAFDVKVIDRLVVNAPTTLNLAVGRNFSRTVGADNVLGTLRFAKGGGSWPSGIDIDPSTGVISGTVTAATGKYPGLTVVVTDTFVVHGKTYLDVTSSEPFTADVIDLPTAFALKTPLDDAPTLVNELKFVVNAADSQSVIPLNAAWGTAIPSSGFVVDQSAGVPPGLGVSSQSDAVVVSGTPTVTGQYGPIVITATDAAGQTAKRTVYLSVVNPKTPIVLAVANVATKINIPFEMQATSSNTYGAAKYYSYDIDGDTKTHVPGQYQADLDIGLASGIVSGSFASAGDRVVNVYVTDTTERVTSKPITVAVTPNVRLTVPAQIEVAQSATMNQTTTTAYKLGTATYSKGKGDWPEGFEVNPATGYVYTSYYDQQSGKTLNYAVGDVGRYPGLTIKVTDTFVSAGTTYTDAQESNEFAINVTPTKATPSIANQSKTVLGTEGTQIASWKPLPQTGWSAAVIEGTNQTRPWKIPGTKYRLSYDLTQYGLSFDEDTATISGTPTAPFVLTDMKVTVVSPTGASDTTPGFFMGVTPKDDLALKEGQKLSYIVRSGVTGSSDPIEFENFIGTLSFSVVGVSPYPSVKNATSFTSSDNKFVARYNAGNTSWSQKGVNNYTFKASDVFGRAVSPTIVFEHIDALGLTVPKTYIGVDVGKDVSNVQTPAVSNVKGTANFSATGLPTGFYVASDGSLQGNVPLDYDGPARTTVTLTLTDSYDGEKKEATYDLILVREEPKRFWKLKALSSLHYTGYFELNELAFVRTDGVIMRAPYVRNFSGVATLYDGNLTTRTGGSYAPRDFIYEFFERQDISSVQIYDNSSTNWMDAFEVYSSADGVNWTLEGSRSGLGYKRGILPIN